MQLPGYQRCVHVKVASHIRCDDGGRALQFRSVHGCTHTHAIVRLPEMCAGVKVAFHITVRSRSVRDHTSKYLIKFSISVREGSGDLFLNSRALREGPVGN